jgi:formylglycine-generating enzyme required for sulfatase activity
VATAPSSDSATVGLVREQPKEGRFVKTSEGFMVPYTATIPGTEVEFEMVPIAGGTFKMGSPESEKGRKPDEGPQFEVTIEPFWMGKFEITWAEYREFMKMTDVFKGFESLKPQQRVVTMDNESDAVTSPSNLYDPTFTFRNGQKPRLPAVTMSQFAAKQYTKWLSRLVGDFYRLPTEAEWEYAARAGTTTRYFFGDDPTQLGKYAWFFDNSTETTHEVGQKQPSPWGLYDIYGNAGEWVLDQYLPEGYKKFGRPMDWKDAIVWPTKLFPRVLRGGSWDSDAADCRSAARRKSSDDEWRETDPNSPKSPWWFTEPEALGVGFRIIRPLKPAPEADRTKYWDADLPSIAADAKDRLDQGRGARGLVDPSLPDAVQKLDEQRKRAGGR